MNRNAPAGLVHVQPMPEGGPARLTGRVVQHLEEIFARDGVEAGGRLPSERTVASDLGVSRNTVTAAYANLEQRGLIRRIRGKGAFRCNGAAGDEAFSWSGKIAAGAHLVDEPVLEVLARSCGSGLPHPLSAGTPSMECFPTAEYRLAVNKVIERDFPRAVSIAPTEGQPRLRRAIAKWTGSEANRVSITSGAQEAIDLLVRCLIEPGDYAIIDSPCYPGAIQCLRAAGARLVGWDTEWSLDKLESLLIRYRPKLIFTTPTFQNPTGRVMPLATRAGLLELAARYHVPIVEDDVYSRTYMDGRPAPESLLRLDKRSIVAHISTFSKILAPGLRVGWVVAPLYMVKQLSLMKMRANLFTGGLNQLVLAELIESGQMDRHLERVRAHHAELRDAALPCAKAGAEQGLFSYHRPGGGLYLWLRLKEHVDLDNLLGRLEHRGLSIAPGNVFFPSQTPHGGASYVRVCFTAASAGSVAAGMGILVETLRETARRHSASAGLSVDAGRGVALSPAAALRG